MISVINKIKKNGIQWFYHRVILEYRIPQTLIGKKLKSFNVFLYRAYSIISKPFQYFRRNKTIQDTLYLFYDFEICPITFNFCETLCMANAHRAELNLKYLHVICVPGPNDGLRYEPMDYESIINKNLRHWRVYNILLPLTRLIPACRGFSYCASRVEAEFMFKKINAPVYPKGYSTLFPEGFFFNEAVHRSSSHLMAVSATSIGLSYVKKWLDEKALGRRVITITLRQYNYNIARNSNLQAWVNFAKKLDSKKYFIVIIPDSDYLMNNPTYKLDRFEHFTEASWNIELRTALYESSYLNLGVNNGPFVLCWLNKNCRYIMFKIVTNEAPQTTQEALIKHGFVPEKSPSFATKYQKWVWADDTEKTINKEFEEMCLFIEENEDAKQAKVPSCSLN